MSVLFKKSAKVILAVLIMIFVCNVFMITAYAQIIIHKPEEGVRVPVYGNRSGTVRVQIEPTQEYQKTVLNGEEITVPYYLCIYITCSGKKLYYVRFAYSSVRMIEFDLPITDIGTYRLDIRNDYPIKEETPTGDRVYYSYPRLEDFRSAEPEISVTFEAYHAEHIEEGTYTIDKEPTCGENGSMSKHCQRCHAIIEESIQEIPATGEHVWDTGIITVKPTTADAGVKTYTCAICGKTRTEPVDKLKITVAKNPTIKKPTAGKNKITVNWTHFKMKSGKTKAVWKNIRKVEVECATDKAFRNTVKTAAFGKKKTKAVIRGL